MHGEVTSRLSHGGWVTARASILSPANLTPGTPQLRPEMQIAKPILVTILDSNHSDICIRPWKVKRLSEKLCGGTESRSSVFLEVMVKKP